jgi:hypothetical protein
MTDPTGTSAPITPGRRIPDAEWFDRVGVDLQPGDYGRMWIRHQGWKWFNVLPNGELGQLSDDHVVEHHEDGTITVHASIQGRVVDSKHIAGDGPISGSGWHGYLERGVWREA